MLKPVANNQGARKEYIAQDVAAGKRQVKSFPKMAAASTK
jgi:hypothetical protein